MGFTCVCRKQTTYLLSHSFKSCTAQQETTPVAHWWCHNPTEEGIVHLNVWGGDWGCEVSNTSINDWKIKLFQGSAIWDTNFPLHN